MDLYILIHGRGVGSSILRGVQIAKYISKSFRTVKVIDWANKPVDTVLESFNSNTGTVLWVKELCFDLVNHLKHKGIYSQIYDVVDNYVIKKIHINNILDRNVVDGVIANNRQMCEDLRMTTDFVGDIISIPHHWDPRLNSLKLTNQNVLRFGYLGSIGELMREAKNLYGFNKIRDNMEVDFLDSESGWVATDTVYKKEIYYPRPDNKKFNNLVVPFNCHISIRKDGSDHFKYKTSAKVVTAAALGHNIITTKENSALDVLPSDYPFYLDNSSTKCFMEMVELVKADYNSDRTLWKRGLDMMADVKNNYNIENTVTDYINYIYELGESRPISKVFCIGLQGLAEIELNKGLKKLGYKTHFFDYKKSYSDFSENKSFTQFITSNSKISILSKFQAFSGFSLWYNYKLLDKLFPGSKFILPTCRFEADWKNRMSKLGFTNYKQNGSTKRYINELVREKHEIHVNEVREYFKNRSEDLLVVDTEYSSSWDDICKFLDKDQPIKELPSLV